MDDPNERRPDVLVVDAEGKDLLNRVVPEAAYKTAREAAPDEISREVTTPDGRTYLLFSPADDHEMKEHRHRQFPPMPGDALDEEQTLDCENRPPPPLPKHSRFGPYDARLLVALLASILCGRRLHC